MEFQRVQSLDEIWNAAREKCEHGPLFNLLLAFEFPITLVESTFVSLHEDRAKEWQSETPPETLPFSHGHFFKGEKGIQHVIGELRGKRGSRRALVSLIDMDDIVGHGDEPIPSFMVAQFGIEARVIYATSYFRALEVNKFLPVNIAEICLLLRRVQEEFQFLEIVRFVLMAFRAYEDPEFVLDRARIDMQPRGRVALAVSQGNVESLMEWLEDKKRRRTLIELNGLVEMDNVVDDCVETYSRKFRSDLRGAVSALGVLRELRRGASESEEIDREYARFVGLLDECIGELKRMAAGEQHGT